MRSFLKLTLAGLIAASALTPALAATHHKRAPAAPVESGYSDQAFINSPVAAHPGLPPVVNQQPNACFTDEGYGRYASCDQAGF
jgi:hypothetical protein